MMMALNLQNVKPRTPKLSSSTQAASLNYSDIVPSYWQGVHESRRKAMVRGLSKALRHAAKDVRRLTESDENAWDGSGSASGSSSFRSQSEPRTFSHEVKEACWRQAAAVKGRDQERWRRDAVGNLVFRKLIGCQGCLCYNYDHVVPYSKGGKSTLENCQILQTAANSAKGARTSVSKTELMQRSTYCRLSGRDMDIMEVSAYGDVHREDGGGFLGCRLQ